MEIDYVVPMVFDDDVLWQNDYIAWQKPIYGSHKNNVRYRSWGTEHLLIKCIKTFMPFIRTIHILLARESQVRSWMEEEGVHIVFHKDFIPYKFRPCFSSCTIEMFLHRIPDLAERFIYGNDDMFPLKPLSEDAFFEDGIPCFHLHETPYPEKPNIFQRKCMNQQNMLGSLFGRHYDKTLLRNGHSLAPIMLNTCYVVHEKFKKAIEEGITPRRSATSYNQYIYTLWHYFGGEYVDRKQVTKYLSAKNTIEEIRNAISADDYSIVCINDNESLNDFSKHAEALYNAIDEKLKFHSNSGGVA